MKARAIRFPGDPLWRIQVEGSCRYLHLERVFVGSEELLVTAKGYADKGEAERVAREVKDMEMGEWV